MLDYQRQRAREDSTVSNNKEVLTGGNQRFGAEMKLTKPRLWRAGSCLLCIALAWRNSLAVEGTEFSGGRITGPILMLQNIGTLLFVVALVLTFFSSRIAAATAVIASLLCLPLYLYFTAPGPFRWAFRGEYSVPLRSNFVWDLWAVLAMIMLAFAIYTYTRTIRDQQ